MRLCSWTTGITLLWLASLLLFLHCGSLGQSADRVQNDDDLPREERYLYRQVPDIAITDENGTRPLSSLLQEGPVLFTMVYTRCAGVCYPFSHSLKQALEKVGGMPEGWRVVVVSFDPRDSLATMQMMATALGLEHNRRWLFGIASPEEVNRMAVSIGYWRRWDPSLQQYDHPAVLIGIRQDLRIARFLVGATVSPVRLQEVMRELRGDFVRAYPLPRKNVIFSCFQYDPSQGVQVNWGFFIMLLPGIVTFGGTGWYSGGVGATGRRVLTVAIVDDV